MRDICYALSNPGLSDEYADGPAAAAVSFVTEWEADSVRTAIVVVKPLDDEARAITGWEDNGDGPFMLLRVSPIVRWQAAQIASFAGQRV